MPPEANIYIFLWYIANSITFKQLANLFGVCHTTSRIVVQRVSNWLITIADEFVIWPQEAVLDAVK